MNVFIFCFGTHKSTSESVHHDKVNIMYLLLFNCSSKNKIKISFYVNFTNIYIWKNVHYLRNHYIHIVLSSLQKSLCHAIIESKATIINSFQFYSTSHLVVQHLMHCIGHSTYTWIDPYNILTLNKSKTSNYEQIIKSLSLLE